MKSTHRHWMVAIFAAFLTLFAAGCVPEGIGGTNAQEKPAPVIEAPCFDVKVNRPNIEVAPGGKFNVDTSIKNCGKADWPIGVHLVQVSGFGTNDVLINPEKPGATFRWTLEFTAPATPNDYTLAYDLMIGDKPTNKTVDMQVKVVAAVASTNTPTATATQTRTATPSATATSTATVTATITPTVGQTAVSGQSAAGSGTPGTVAPTTTPGAGQTGTPVSVSQTPTATQTRTTVPGGTPAGTQTPGATAQKSDLEKSVDALGTTVARLVSGTPQAQPTAGATPKSDIEKSVDALSTTVARLVSGTPQAQPTAGSQATQVTGASSTNTRAATESCDKHGTVAWQNDNQLSGALYGEAPVNGLDEVCWVVAQTWTDQGGKPERWFFAVRPHSIAWISGHRGGTGWYFGGSIDDVRKDLEKQRAEINVRDGAMTEHVVILPDDWQSDKANFRLITRTRGPATGLAPASAASSTAASTSAPAATAAPSTTGATASAAVAGKCEGGNATGPAILEYGPPSTVRKLSEGQTASYGKGGCFDFPDQASLDGRWDGHKAEFLRKYPTGRVVE